MSDGSATLAGVGPKIQSVTTGSAFAPTPRVPLGKYAELGSSLPMGRTTMASLSAASDLDVQVGHTGRGGVGDAGDVERGVREHLGIPVLSRPWMSPPFTRGTRPVHSGRRTITLTEPVVATVPPTTTDSIFWTPVSPAWSGSSTRRLTVKPESEAVAPVVRPVVPSWLVQVTVTVVAVAETAAVISRKIRRPR